jgi:general secretion pathway protein D
MSIRILCAGVLLGALLAARPGDRARAGAPHKALVQRVYPVADLVIPFQNTISPIVLNAGKDTAANPAPPPAQSPQPTYEEHLIRLITAGIVPRSWSEMGGRGTIDYFPLTMTLVISQTPAVHQQVVALLEELRRLQDTEVVLEVRLLSVPDGFEDRAGLKLAGAPLPSPREPAVAQKYTPPSPAYPLPREMAELQACAARIPHAAQAALPDVAHLDDAGLLKLLQAAQGDPRCSVLQAPRLTVFDGQKAVLQQTDRQIYVTGIDLRKTDGRVQIVPKNETPETGWRLGVQPAVAPDRRSVNLSLQANLTRLASPKVPIFPVIAASARGKDLPAEEPTVFTQYVQQPKFTTVRIERILKIPDGGTVAFHGGPAVLERRPESAPPTLARISLLNRLLSGTRRAPRHVLVLVTARVLVKEEQEESRSEVAVPDPAAAPGCLVREEPCTQQVTAPAPARLPVKHVKRRTFRLRYLFHNVGPSGVKNVEVWFTRDGHAWQRVATDASPSGADRLQVETEGRYGFTLIPRSGAGLAAAPPAAGDRPQIWVEVDETRPVVNVLDVTVGGTARNQLTVAWSASDKNLRTQPITVSCAGSSAGPWKVVGDRLPNTGRFTFSAQGLPGRVHIKVSAADEAGNVGSAVTREPVILDTHVPRVGRVEVGEER